MAKRSRKRLRWTWPSACEARAQYEEFVNGKKIAATRCRKALQTIKRVAQEARVEIQGIKKAPGEPPKA